MRLGDLVGRSFRARHWRKLPYVGQLSPARLRRLTAGLRYGSVAELVEDAQATRCKLWFHTSHGVADTFVPLADSLAYFAAGMTLYFERRDPLVDGWGARLAADLGLRPSSAPPRPSIFASPAGHGAPLHFDRFEVFTLQLIGAKRWWIAPPPLAEVTASHSPRRSPSRELDAYRHDPIVAPTRGDMRCVTLAPGGVLYLPRGSWHETEADSDGPSASLNFAFDPPTRAAELARLVQFVAEQDVTLRASIGAGGLAADRAALGDALARLGAVVAELGADLAPPTIAKPARFRRNRLASLAFDGEARATIVVRGGGEIAGFALEMAPDAAALARFVISSPAPFTLQDARRQVPSLSAARCRAVMTLFTRAGLVVPVG